MSETGWSPSMVSTRMRGVMTSAAVRPENLRVRAMKLAVPASRVPIAAERRTREASSAGVRAPEISSLASRPKMLSTLLEKPLSTTMAGLKIAVKISCGRARALPTWNDSAMAMFFGTSSPISMDRRVAKAIAMNERHGGNRGFRQAQGAQRGFEQFAHRWFHDVAGEQGGDGDAQLAAGELRGQGLEAFEQGRGGSVAVIHGPLDGGLVKGNEGEFNGYEEAGSEDEQQACSEKEPLHLAACFRGGGAVWRPAAGVSGVRISGARVPGRAARRRMVSRGRP